MPCQSAAVLSVLFVASLLVQPPPAEADQLQELARHPTWRKLLHAAPGSGESEVLSTDFFLSPAGGHDPEAELRATLDAYSAPWPKEGDSHARCRFPARYFWLSQQITLPDYTPDPPQCATFARWSLPHTVQSVSLFLVSGYLGNPASVFGHSLLKLNTGAKDDQAGLFDLTVNYGALVPENEPVWRYILRGLGGGYQAGFSDRYFYTQDLVYSRTEFRDIWDYELQLSEAQRTLLILHLWEMLGRKFRYYFLDKNCACRLAELLELIVDEPLLEHARFWYAPVEIFHRLETIDREQRQRKLPGLIRSVRFIPSSQRRLQHQFSLLDSPEQAAAQAVIRQGPGSMPDHLARIAHDRQPEVLDTLLAYYNYRLTAEQPAPSAAISSGKDQALLARLRLPPQTAPLPEVPVMDSPAKGNRPMLAGFGLGADAEEGRHLRLRWAGFSQEAVGRNSLDGDELAVLDAAIGLNGSEHGLFVDSLDLIRIRKLKTDILAADGENPWSWQLRSGFAENDARFFTSFGAGRAWKISPQLTAYAITDAAACSRAPYFRLRPHLGLFAGGSIKGRLAAGLETVDYQGGAQPFIGVELQWSLAEQTSLFLSVEQAEAADLALDLKWFW